MDIYLVLTLLLYLYQAIIIYLLFNNNRRQLVTSICGGLPWGGGADNQLLMVL